jgi:hypothetical protein
MAEKKKATGAGPYSGYSKNYQPIKSSKGTAAEKLVQKGVRALAKDGSKTARVKGPDGKMRTVTIQEAGGLGKVVSAVAKNLLPKGEKAAAGGRTGGAKVVPGPLTRGQKAQNKSAETYKTVTPRTEKQKAADAASSARMKKVQSKARNANRNAAAAGGAGFAAGVVASDKKPKGAPSNKSVQAAAKKKQQAKGK